MLSIFKVINNLIYLQQGDLSGKISFFFHSAPVYGTQANLTVTPLIQTLHYQMQHNLQNISQLSLLILRGYHKIFISLARSWSYNLY